MGSRNTWIEVNLSGLRKVLSRRGRGFAIYELVQNAWDESTTKVTIDLTIPKHGVSQLVVTDDSPKGFQNLSHAYRMFEESEKKSNPTKRGAFNLGEKLVLALCDEATITSTTGRVTFNEKGRVHSKHPNHRSEVGTEFRGTLKLTVEEYENIARDVFRLIPPVATWFNGIAIPAREALAEVEVDLPTTIADAEGYLRRTKRRTTVYIFEPLPGETPMLYEMGIPVVETGDTWHVDVSQKVPVNMERDNVPPSYLTAIRVAVANRMQNHIDAKIAAEPWVRVATGDPRISEGTLSRVLDLRFGERRVSYDPSDVGSNREAASQDYAVVSGGSLSAGEWENARQHGLITPAGQAFPTTHGAKTPAKVYDRSEWTPEMRSYALFVESVTPELVGHVVTLRFIKDPKMVCGQFFGTYYNVNLAKHNPSNWQANIELMLHELAHTVVQSNDHLSHQFYETVGRLGAKLALLAVRYPALVSELEYR